MDEQAFKGRFIINTDETCSEKYHLMVTLPRRPLKLLSQVVYTSHFITVLTRLLRTRDTQYVLATSQTNKRKYSNMANLTCVGAQIIPGLRC